MKNKLFLLVLLLSFLVFSFNNSKIALAANKPSDYRIGVSYSAAMNSDKPSVVLFYADWCGYCKRFMPNFASLYRLYGNKYNFVMINADTNSFLARDMHVRGLPTVFIIDSKKNKRIQIPSESYQNLKDMSSILNKYFLRRNSK